MKIIRFAIPFFSSSENQNKILSPPKGFNIKKVILSSYKTGKSSSCFEVLMICEPTKTKELLKYSLVLTKCQIGFGTNEIKIEVGELVEAEICGLDSKHFVLGCVIVENTKKTAPKKTAPKKTAPEKISSNKELK